MVEDLPVDPVAFLRRYPPFDRTTPAVMGRIAASLRMRYVPAGEKILEEGGPVNATLWVVRKGIVRLERHGEIRELVEPGECFGFPSLIAGGSPQLDATAAEDCLVYAIPDHAFRLLLEEPHASRFFMDGLTERLRAGSRGDDDGFSGFLGLRLRDVATHAPVFVPADTTVGEAARRMREQRVGSVLVDSDPPGILTERDLSARVLAAGRGPDTKVDEVMTAPVLTVPPETPVLEALLLLTERRIRHLPLRDESGIVGFVSATDLVRLQARDPLSLLRRLQGGRLDVAHYRDEILQTVDRLAKSGIGAVAIARLIASMNDALVRTVTAEVEERLGAPPARWAWVVYGSDGRREQCLPTDQDNALIWEDGPAEHAAYFEAFADHVVARLIAAGFPECRGGYMASRWRGPESWWRERFQSWLRTPHPQSILDANTLFDLRVAAGTLDLEALLEEKQAAAREAPFLKALAESCVALELPLGFFHQLRAGSEGLDLKRGIVLIVTLARLFSLASGGREVGTLARLEEAAGSLGNSDAATLAEAFSFLLGLRLEHQLRRVRGGHEPSGKVALSELNSMERRFLKEIFTFLRQAQSALPQRFGF